ncbi:hypothetical protein CEP54_008957 [Fusarium duplospermum]|uniref:Uncharacterized protein n=1 Tax=Fusarium duplospermum TaxID=1325734 RepID=A0A428PTL8_9HYPO|nr:hypothetical protein CEP54_008957 [Fusarium duplospermum]
MAFNNMRADSRDTTYAYNDAPPPYPNDPATTVLEPAWSAESRSPPFPVPTLHQNLLPSSLPKPIAIPATSSKLGSPFLRAFPPILEERYGIPPETFLRFLDDLNRATVASPPVQVLGLAGSVVSMVPLQTAQIIGSSVNVAADLATFAVSKSRSELCISKANRELFAPRGLRVELAKLDSVARFAQIPILDSEGKIEKNALILGPLEDAMEQSSMNLTVQQRRLQALEPWIAPLDLTPLLELGVPDNFISKMHGSASERQRKKEEEKVAKHRVKAQESWPKDLQKAEEDYEKDMRKTEKRTIKAHKKHMKDERAEHKLRKLDEKRQKCEEEYQKDINKANEVWRKDDKEEKSVRKVLWILIRSLNNIPT